MTTPLIEAPDPIALASRLLEKATAISLLAAKGCYQPELFALQVEPYLRAEPETGLVNVVDKKGAIRHGVTPQMFMDQLAAEYNVDARGRFFRAEEPPFPKSAMAAEIIRH